MRSSIPLSVGLAFSELAAAFGTINAPMLLKQHNEHEMITRLAFQCPSGNKSDGSCFEPRSLDQLAGYHVNLMGIAIPGAGVNGAVGAPDTFDPIPEGPEAHCDDADFLDVPGYPQTRAEANAKLQRCLDHLRHRFRQAVGAAERLLDERNRVRRDMVRIDQSLGGDCTFAFPGWQSDTLGRAKCSTIEGFGRALHGIQDFYAHSNWADSADPAQPISISNPPGLGMSGIAPFLDLRANGTIPPDEIPRNLTTGCFALPDMSLGSGACQGRITHHDLSKDKGIINLDGSFGTVDLDPRSGALPSNFHRAVKAAVHHSREAWESFRAAIRDQYGSVRGDLMICTLVSDDPVKDCRKRTLAILVDTSSGSQVSGGIITEQQLVDALNSMLDQHGLDRVAFIDNRAPAVLRYPMGSPANATLDFSQPSGELCIASGLELGIDEIIEAQPDTYTDRGAIVLLSTGAESSMYSADTLKQLRRAAQEGIRVHHACISMPRATDEHGSDAASWSPCSPADALVPAVLKTGGVAAFVDGSGVARPAHFADLIMDRGLTATDDNDEGAAKPHTRMYSGIALADFLSPASPTKSFVYQLTAGENVNFTVGSVPMEGEGSEACFTVTLWYKYADIEIATHTRCGHSSPLSMAYKATEKFDVVLEAEYGDMAPRNDLLLHREEILFVISVDTDMPAKVETHVKKTTSILSSSATVEVPGSTPLGFLTSETVEILSSTATVNGNTSTATESHKVADQSPFPFPRPTREPLPMCSIPTFTATTMAGNYTVDYDAGEPPGEAASGLGVLAAWR